MNAVHAKSNSVVADTPIERRVSTETSADYKSRHAAERAIHPVIARHPGSGRKVLFVNHNYTERFEGWTREESLPLLNYLIAQATRPEHTCRFRWEEGSIAFWDNRAVMHLALNDYHGHRRLMHRVTIKGPWLEECPPP
jgi:taurine dioxygenase